MQIYYHDGKFRKIVLAVFDEKETYEEKVLQVDHVINV